MRVSFFCSGLIALLALPLSLAAADNTFQQAHGSFFHLYNTEKDELGIDYTWIDEQEEKDGPGKYELQILNFDGEVPLALGRDAFLLFGGQYGMRIYDFDRVPLARTASDDDTFYKIVGGTGVGMFLSDDILLIARGTLGSYSDLDDGIDEDSFIGTGDARFVYQVNPGAQLIFGVRYSQDFDDTPLFPIAGIRLLNESGTLRLSLTAPLDAEIKYAVTPEGFFYIRGSIVGEQYRVNSGEDVSSFNVSIRDQFIGAGTELWFLRTIKVGAEVGYSVGSELDYKARDSGQFSGDLDDAMYLRVSLGVNL